jgi:four helix bundle protein
MSIALKEAKETRYWLTVISKTNMIKSDISGLLQENEAIFKIISRIIISTKQNISRT